MVTQWMTLMAILLVYIPVAIDATVLHVAAPTSVALGSSNELLWIIDIYSLVMAGMVLPMGALGDKIGFKRLLLLGSAIFGIASLCAALSPTAMTLIASRALLAVGAAMIVPATLAGIRSTFAEAVSAIWRWGCGQRSAPAARPSARWWAVSRWSISTGGRCSRSPCADRAGGYRD